MAQADDKKTEDPEEKQARMMLKHLRDCLARVRFFLDLADGPLGDLQPVEGAPHAKIHMLALHDVTSDYLDDAITAAERLNTEKKN